MKDLLIVDGYNIIHAWPELKVVLKAVNYEAARQRLIDTMCDFSAHNNYETLVVFDAHMTKGKLRHVETYPPIKVVFTAEHETADQYIEKAVNLHDTRKSNVYVATSDALEQSIIFGSGGARLSARELLRMVQASKQAQDKKIDSMQKESRNTIAQSIREEVLERLDNMVKDVRLEE